MCRSPIAASQSWNASRTTAFRQCANRSLTNSRPGRPYIGMVCWHSNTLRGRLPFNRSEVLGTCDIAKESTEAGTCLLQGNTTMIGLATKVLNMWLRLMRTPTGYLPLSNDDNGTDESRSNVGACSVASGPLKIQIDQAYTH